MTAEIIPFSRPLKWKRLNHRVEASLDGKFRIVLLEGGVYVLYGNDESLKAGTDPSELKKFAEQCK